MSPIVALLRAPDADHSVELPSYESAGAAGADIRANLPPHQRERGLTIAPGDRTLVPTGLSMAIEPGYEVQVRPRSGLALRKGLTIANSPGTIDCDYRGPVGVILINLGPAPAVISHGDRVAQLVVAPVASARFEEVTELDDTRRGSGGFGSTGVN